MPNSDYAPSKLELLKAALRSLGKSNAFHSTTDLQNAGFALQDLIKELDPDGTWLWTIDNTETSITLTNGTRSYSAGASGASVIPLYVKELVRFDLWNGTKYEELDIYTKTESVATYLREGTGRPVAVFLQKAAQPSGNKLHVFQTPNASFTGRFTFERYLYDMDGASDLPDFPGHWNNCLKKGVAKILAPEYGKTIQERALINTEYDKALMEAKAKSAPKKLPSRPSRIQDF